MSQTLPLSAARLTVRPAQLASMGWVTWTLGFGLLSALWPRDAGFDVLHYHLQNGWSAYHGRLHRDLAPSEMHSFLNPAYQMVVWALIEHLPGRAVAFLLGCAQSLTLPALYLLARRLGAACKLEMGWKTALLLACLGMAAAPSFAVFASIRNDDLGALAFIAALALALPPRGDDTIKLSQVALAAALVGAMAGMKLTNTLYVAGFAGFVLVLARDWQMRLRLCAVSAGAGLAGLLTLGGPWMWAMWSEFANPVFPNFAGAFPGPDAPVDVARDTRYLPGNVFQALSLPIRASFNGFLINEFATVDLRLALVYLSALVLGGVAVRQHLTSKGTPLPRAALALTIATLVTFAIWMGLFSIMRYAMGLWLLAPLLAWIAARLLVPKWPEPRQAWRYGAICSAALLVSTQPESNRRIAWQSWDEPYLSVTRPADLTYDDALILIASSLPAGFTATAFPEARLTHVHAQDWSAPFLAPYRARRVDPVIAGHDGPLYLIHCLPKRIELADGRVLENVYPPELPLKAIAEHGLHLTEAGCRELPTNMSQPETIWQICPLSRE
ncbi:MAG: hypothetical protein MRY64_06640 [Hyphomonadaceae bacterium]|nr:hypothetical protein [Hyphomonadaceae bacterium]